MSLSHYTSGELQTLKPEIMQKWLEIKKVRFGGFLFLLISIFKKMCSLALLLLEIIKKSFELVVWLRTKFLLALKTRTLSVNYLLPVQGVSGSLSNDIGIWIALSKEMSLAHVEEIRLC